MPRPAGLDARAIFGAGNHLGPARLPAGNASRRPLLAEVPATARHDRNRRGTNGTSGDRAILMLLAVYGFRAGEVVRLRLEDFDWQRETLSLTRGKTKRAQTYPRRVPSAMPVWHPCGKCDRVVAC